MFLSIIFSLRSNHSRNEDNSLVGEHSGNLALLECSRRMSGKYREGANFPLDKSLRYGTLEDPLPVSPGCSEPKNRCSYCCCSGWYLNCYSSNCDWLHWLRKTRKTTRSWCWFLCCWMFHLYCDNRLAALEHTDMSSTNLGRPVGCWTHYNSLFFSLKKKTPVRYFYDWAFSQPFICLMMSSKIMFICVSLGRLMTLKSYDNRNKRRMVCTWVFDSWNKTFFSFV